ncbi:siderophore ABC transporter substrate-binding protein [Moraxella marmotae]|uniref:siderophore ABC transporter substrate-binding protein n=1 Tax=Moraxella marmotae TaxID=3344520 RepID=UPI0035F38B81
MKIKLFHKIPLVVALTLGLMAAGCQQSDVQNVHNAPNQPEKSATDNALYPVEITHRLGKVSINALPEKVVALDMNEVDFLDQLEIPIAGMVKDFIPHFLQKYQNRDDIADLGAIVQPNLDKVYGTKPDLILATPLHDNQYAELSHIAPTLRYDIDFKSSDRQIEQVANHLRNLGKIFNKQELAERKIKELKDEVKNIQNLTKDRPETALIILHNNGAFSNFGLNSRYGFVFQELGVKPAVASTEASLHGQPISSEFINQAKPDILFIIDRTAVMEHKPVINTQNVSNPLLKQTPAWQNNKVVFVDADAWYTTAASPTSIAIIINDVAKAYR